jgi:hypothetical protein
LQGVLPWVFRGFTGLFELRQAKFLKKLGGNLLLTDELIFITFSPSIAFQKRASQ